MEILFFPCIYVLLFVLCITSFDVCEAQTTSGFPSHRRRYCQLNEQDCWPTASELTAFRNSLTNGSRVLLWPGGSSPRVGPVPENSPSNQPLFGLGAQAGGLSALYEANSADLSHTCFEPASSPYFSDFCKASTVNNPYPGWQAAFVVFPLNTHDVQTAVKFAVAHDLCIAVAGAGHDFLARHSCPNGLLIRTILMKEATWPGAAHNDFSYVKLGPAYVADEAQSVVAAKGRAIAVGWIPTVGIAGWTLAGGHGPLGPSFGLGSDNLLAAEVVLADGSVVTASETENSDLFRALRGGGGSTWGVITAFTIQTHPIPHGGFTMLNMEDSIPLCDTAFIDNFIDAYASFMLNLDSKWGGLTWHVPTRTSSSSCAAVLNVVMVYIYQGPANSAEVTQAVATFSRYIRSISVSNFPHYYALISTLPADYIIPTNWEQDVPSSFVSREGLASGVFAESLKAHNHGCLQDPSECYEWEIYQDLTGNLGSPQASFNSFHPAFRTSMLHIVFHMIPKDLPQLSSRLSGYPDGAAYFAESLYRWPDEQSWQSAYWLNQYDGLLRTKLKYDPHLHFYCRNCVGSELVNVGL